MDGKDTTFCLFVCLPYGPEGGPRLWWRGVAIPNGKALNHCGKQAFFFWWGVKPGLGNGWVGAQLPRHRITCEVHLEDCV